MSDGHGTLEVLGRHLTLALEPLRDSVSNLDRFRALMARLGWDVTGLPPSWTALGTSVDTAIVKLDALGDPPTAQQVFELVTSVKDAYDAIEQINVAPGGVDAGPFLAEIGDRLIEILLTDYLAAALPSTFTALQALDVIDLEPVAATATRPSFVRVNFRWSQIPMIVSEPGSLPARVYGWGTPNVRISRVLDHLSGLAASWGFPVQIVEPPEDLVGAYADIIVEPLPPTAPSLVVPFYYITIAGQQVEASFVLRELPATNGHLPGLVLEPHIPSQFPATIQLAPDLTLRIRAGTNVAETFGILIRPDGISVKYPFQPGTTPPSAGVGVAFDYSPTAPTLIVGTPGSTRLEFAGATIDAGANFVNGEFDLAIGAQLRDLAFILSTADADSFIRSILGSGESRIEMSLGVEASRSNGVRFTGSGAFEVALHPHLQLGPVLVDEVTVRLLVPSPRPPDLRLELGAGIAGDLGPLHFFVRGIGVLLDSRFAPGNLGPLDVALGFKPPTGIGLSIDAGGFKGGGFLYLDAEKGEYAGGLELEFKDVLTVKAIGILSTRMPDGSPGFSLLLILTGEFPPIQLSFGFTLLGVGGLLGLNRTVVIATLQSGVRDGSLGSILFPRDVVANAPRIINDLKRIFPPLSDRFLIGPMAKLGWGTPTLVSLEIGLILEIPRPAFAIVGILRIEVPAEDLPILNLKVSFLGVVDFEKGQLSFDASLFDSRLLTFTLTGDMAVRVYWGENANFLLTVGGFHPAYSPPPMGLGPLRRLGIVIFQGNPNLRAEAYFAITSNTVQFGARVELNAGADIFNVYGFLSLDVLVQFDPFHFIAEIAAMLAVRTGSSTLFSVRLELMLEGPTPWHATGRASFEIGFIFTITISVHFDVTFGEPRTTTLPPVRVLPKLREALEQRGNWRATLPAGSRLSVSLREQPPDDPALVVHPFGSLEIGQKVVPFNLPISRFGTQRPEGGSTFRISEVLIGATSAATTNVKDQFAPAQFIEMTDAEKLSRRSFERFDAGLQVGAGDASRADYSSALDVVYEVIYVPERHAPLRFRLGVGLFDAFLRSSAVTKSALSHAKSTPSGLGTPAVVVEAERFVIASTRDLSVYGEVAAFESQAEAHAALERFVAGDPALDEELQVVAMYEATSP